MGLYEQSKLAKVASKQIRNASVEVRNQILKDFITLLDQNKQEIINANEQDIILAKKNGMKSAFIDRLTLTPSRLQGIQESIQEIIQLDDPLHRILEEKTLSSGIQLQRVSVPMGLIGIIFESRPNVAADSSALCIKSGNACLLKGGKDTYQSCFAIVKQIKEALVKNGISPDVIMLAEKPSHEEVETFISNRENLDLLIPRGGKNLIQSVVQNAKVPVIETGAGVCHVFVDESADIDMATNIVMNAKCQRPSVCNAMETLLVHEAIAQSFLDKMLPQLKQANVKIYADDKALQIDPSLEKADEESWATEYNDLMMNLRIVSNIDEAIQHIETFSTHHSEAIISENKEHVVQFFNEVDSACLYHNASTRFTDGFEFGLGGEIGIATQKLHVRGPMGLQALTTYTYLLKGHGEVR